jgi:predicted Zn finger-like uncharacterized protein
VKFFCEQCKAKYQIADEKVAGKTVRMKCRKCGHVIELRAEVTESSAIAHAPTAAPSAGPGAASAHHGAPARPMAPKPPARPPPKPSALATSLTSTKPASAKSERGGGALAGAFRSNVQREDEGSAPFDMADLAPGDDWYVAVNGVPVGPIRVAEVRRKAALGAVTEESLVWQEGLDEWRPLKTFPDLAANVREAAASGRISITPPPPDVRPSSPPPPRAPSSMRTSAASAIPSRVSPSRPVHTPPPAARSNVVPFTARLATAERLDDAPTEIGAFPAGLAAAVVDPFAVPAATPARAAAAAMAPPGEKPPIVASVSLGASPAIDRRKQPPWIVIAMIAGAVAFGAVAALSIFTKPAPPPAVVAQGAAAPPTAMTAAAQPTTAAPVIAPTDPTPTGSTAQAGPAAHGPVIATGGVTHATTAPVAPGRSLDLHSLTGGNVAPSDDPGSGDAPAAAGQCLSGGQVQQVIGLHQLAIRRACWERNPTAKPTVNVSVALTVGPDGSAQNVSTSGDEASVAKCIENDVRGWRFPAMGCSQKTGFSFKFVRQ